MRLGDQLRTKKLVVFLGTGGVGKTTIAAAAALEASAHRKTLVLTIDPARRLADALGVDLGKDAVEVRPNLDAMMLDTKAALDSLVRRYAPNAETLDRVVASPFYAQLSDAFAGSEEFVAMGALHDILADGKYDVVVVDTPPSKHAVDFLAVNRKLIRVFDSGVVRYLFKPTRFLRLGGGYVAQSLARWTSADFLEDVAEFMVTFDEMFMEMESRVRTMERLVRDRDRTSLNIVTSAEPETAPLAIELYREVTERLALRVDSCVVNRYYPRLKGMENVRELAAEGPFREGAIRIVAESTKRDLDEARAFLDDAVAAALFYGALAREHEGALETLEREVAAPKHFVPALAHSVHDLDGLEQVRRHLFAHAV
ncbi:MAG: ArsA family ATPase [Thermoplasmatota archaeon]